MGFVGEIFPSQAQRPEPDPHTHTQKGSVGVCVCNPSSEETKAEGSLMFTGRPAPAILENSQPVRKYLRKSK